jgi:hypothetical protein
MTDISWQIKKSRAMYEEPITIIGPDGETIAFIPCDDTREVEDGAIVECLTPRAKANARLISAAPVLLAFVERFSNLLGTPKAKLMDDLMREARAALDLVKP